MELLEPHELRLAGEEAYDYLLGLAALEAGQTSRASLVLERLVNLYPDHAAGRLDLGRAYYAIGDIQKAKQEFLAVLKYAPPPLAEQTVRQYLAAIEQHGLTGKMRKSGYFELGIGKDSNVNAGVTGGQYYMPILDARLSSKARRVGYGSLGLGGEAAIPLSSESEWLAGGDLRRRHHEHLDVDGTRNADYYDTRSHELRMGVQKKLDERNVLRVMGTLSGQTLDDNQSYRHTQSLLAEWRHALKERTQGSLWLLGQRNRFGSVGDTDFRQYNGNQLLTGVGLTRALDVDGKLMLQMNAFGGKERATDIDAGNQDGDKNIAGLRVGSQWRLHQEFHLVASVGGTLTRYGMTNALFLDKRRDKLWEAALGGLWRLGDNWSLRPQYAYYRSDSNLGAYDYVRHDYSVSLRYDFR